MFSSQGIGSVLFSFLMIFEALQSEILRFKFHSMSSKTLKIPKFKLYIGEQTFPFGSDFL